MPQFETFQQIFNEYSKKTLNWINNRKKQLLIKSTENLNLVQDSNKKQNIQSQSQERKIVQEQNQKNQDIFTPTSRKNRKALSARPSRSNEILKSVCNSKQQNKFFESMHSMHQEQKHIRYSSQPQFQNQNSQKTVESNLLFKKLQQQLQQQASQVDLSKNDLNQIASSIKTKGLAISPMAKIADSSINQNRRNKSLECLLQTIANRENAIQTNNGQNMNQSTHNISLLSPQNLKVLSPSIIHQIQFFQQNSQNLGQQNCQLNNFIQNQAPQSLVELSSTNQSQSSQTVLQQFSQTNLSNNIIPIFENQNSSPVSIFRKPRVLSARRVSSSSQHFNNQGIKVDIEIGKKVSSSNNLQSTIVSSNQAKFQIIQQAQLSTRNNNVQFPIRQLRNQQPFGNTSLNSCQGGSSLSHIPYPGEEDSIQENKKKILQKQNETPCLSSTASSTTISNSQTQSQITTNRSQNKLNLHKSQQIISKPFQSLSSSLQVPILQKTSSLQKQSNSQQQCDNSFKEGSLKLIKAFKVSDENETTPINYQKQINDQCSPLPFSNQQQPQFTYTTDTFPNSPQSQKTKELYIKMIQCTSEQHLASDETPPSVNRQQSNKLIYKPVGSVNKEPDLQKKQLSSEKYQQSQNLKANINSNKNEMTRSLSNRSPNQQRKIKQDLNLNPKDTPLSNKIKFIQDQNKDSVLQIIQTSNSQQNFIKRPINTFSDALINSESPTTLNFPQSTFSLNSLHMINSVKQSQPSSSIIQDMANSFYLNQQNLSSKFQIIGDVINTGTSKNYNCQQQQAQVQSLNSTTTRFKYLDVKGETERIQQSLLLKKQKKGQSQQLSKRKEFLEKMMSSKNINQGTNSQQNSMIINGVQNADVKYLDQITICKLQELFQKQKPSSANSPSRSPCKYTPNSISQKFNPIKLDEQDKHENSAVNELTEGDETTPIARQIKKISTKSQSFSNIFINRQPSSQQYIQDNSKDNHDIINQRPSTFTDLNDFKKVNSKSIDKKGISEYIMPIKTNTLIMTKSCRVSHSHQQINSKSISQNDTGTNIISQNFEATSPIKQISSETISVKDLLQYKKKIYPYNLNQNNSPQKSSIIQQVKLNI